MNPNCQKNLIACRYLTSINNPNMKEDSPYKVGTTLSSRSKKDVAAEVLEKYVEMYEV
jgi:hypothetical protein